MSLTKAIFVLTSLLTVGCTPQARPTAAEEIELRSDGLTYTKKNGQLFSGVEVTTSAKGAVRERRIFLDGKLHGAHSEYLEDGSLKRERSYDHGNLTRMQTWWPNGQLKSTLTFQDNKVCGKVLRYFEDGRIQQDCYFLPGNKLHGHALLYFPDGSIKADAIFHEGKFVSGTMSQEFEEGITKMQKEEEESP